MRFHRLGNVCTSASGAVAAGPHAVTNAGGTRYCYDANGNNISSTDGRSISYTVFDKAELITKGGSRTHFDYGVGQSRFQRVDETLSGGSWSAKRTTTYFGSVKHIVDHDKGETYFQREIAGVAIQRFYTATQIIQTDYLIKDHLGSIHTRVNHNDTLQRMHFSAFGESVDVSDWETRLMGELFPTPGFTGHEHVDELGIIQTR